MEPKKRWDGYVSFSYLEPGAYRAFELSPQLGARRAVRLSALGRGRRAGRAPPPECVISLHDHHGIAGGYGGERRLRARGSRVVRLGLAASGLDAVFENFLDGTATITSKGGWKWTDVMHDLGMHLADVAHQSTVMAWLDGRRHPRGAPHRPDRDGPVHGGAAMIENALDRLDVLFGLGVRMWDRVASRTSWAA